MTEAEQPPLAPEVQCSSYPEELVAVYGKDYSAWLSVARKLTPTTTDAEDIVQDVMAEIMTGKAGFDPERGVPLSAWVAVCVRRRAIDYYRRTTTAKRSQALMPTCDAIAEDNAEEVINRVGTQQYIAALLRIAPLTLAQRETLISQVESGASHSQVAAQLGIPIGTVKSRLHKIQKLAIAAAAKIDSEYPPHL